jgi:diguanylate cyclase (GGDEF)-like protein
VPLTVALYAAGTPGGVNRAAMAAVAALMAVAPLVAVALPKIIARSRLRVPVQLASVAITIVGSSAVALLDGGVTSPLGALELYSLIFFAVGLPRRRFLPMAALCVASYGAVALAGGAAPHGYAWVFACTYGGVAYLCVRHTAALGSLRRRLAEVSRVDALTGCLNRRGFDERLESEFAEATRTGEPVTLVLADLDRFKEINDTYGHQAGDELLTWTARTLGTGLRAHDAVGRLGGDEFAAVLSGTDAEGARMVVDRLRAELGAAAPASMGCASYPAEVTTLADLRQLADERVYADKVVRERRLPAAGAVATARAALGNRVAATVSKVERRRRSIADGGWLGVAVTSVGLGYVTLFAVGHPHRFALGVLLALAWTLGVGMVATAERVSRSTHQRGWMFAYGVAQFLLSASVVALDGGATAALAVGLLAPMPLVALSTPPRVALPLLGVICALYLTIAVVVGAESCWHVALHLGGTIAITLACGIQGRIAAGRRRLLTRLSRVDPLTEVLNRRGFADRFAAELSHAHRHDRPLALMIFDLDGFKQVNDVHGHAAGDELLVWVAATLQSSLHSHDVVGRLGGDEFVVLLTSRPPAEAPLVAERLRAVLGERTGASVGTAELGAHGDDFEALYAHADAALYERKRARSTRSAAQVPWPATRP